MVQVSIVPILQDNYVFIIHDTSHAIVVDPGSAEPVLAFLQKQQLQLLAIFISHHHPDHIAGIGQILQQVSSSIPVYCSLYDRHRISHASHFLQEEDTLDFFGLEFSILALPGHTLGHIAYYCEKQHWLFSGDTLFSLGCGRLFEGSFAQMWTSLEKIKQLPQKTQIYFSHEYTIANLEFAKSVFTKKNWQELEVKIREQRRKGLATVPTNLQYELENNVFLLAKTLEDFASLRQKKDHF